VSTGQVSDMPYPVVMSMPRCMASLAKARGNAAPPTMTFQPLSIPSAALGWARIICRMVGTQWENVTFSRAISSSTRSGEYFPR